MGIIDLVSETISRHLPQTPTFYSVGNHEVAPVNSYPLEGDPEEFSAQWLYDKFAETWIKWLPEEIANSTVRKAGFYTFELTPGWRLISINDNFCLSYNL